MANKTPGQVLFQAMSVALRWRPMTWEQLPDERRDDMEKVAEKAVQSAMELLSQVAAEDMKRLCAIRNAIRQWRGVKPCNDPDLEVAALYDLIVEIEDLLDVPKPEEAEACAEDAAAEPSKSRPPAER